MKQLRWYCVLVLIPLTGCVKDTQTSPPAVTTSAPATTAPAATPTFSPATLTGVKAQRWTASNLKQVTLAIMLYAEKHNYVLPNFSSTEKLKSQVMTFIINDPKFLGPEILPNSAGEPFEANRSLSRRSIDDLQSPATIVLLYEPTARDGGRGVTMIDGHYEWIADEEWPAVAKWSGIKSLSE